MELPEISVDLVSFIKKNDGSLSTYGDDVLQVSLERYKKFLLLNSLHPDKQLAPSKDIDEFWHAHMLNPVHYHEDCLRIFGKILDHNGGFGKGDGELDVLNSLFDQTKELWVTHFGEEYTSSKDSVATCFKQCRIV